MMDIVINLKGKMMKIKSAQFDEWEGVENVLCLTSVCDNQKTHILEFNTSN